ncbi:MAG: hypothetical protein EOP19_18710, partial [Hyphomicrobiales bacterium]
MSAVDISTTPARSRVERSTWRAASETRAPWRKVWAAREATSSMVSAARNDWAAIHDEFEEGGFKQSGLGRLN